MRKAGKEHNCGFSGCYYIASVATIAFSCGEENQFGNTIGRFNGGIFIGRALINQGRT